MRALISLSALVLTATAASAQGMDMPGREPTALNLSTRDVDFQSAISTRAFHRRLEAAAREVCNSGQRELGMQAADRACAREALDKAVSDLSRPMLTAIHTGRPTPNATELAAAQ